MTRMEVKVDGMEKELESVKGRMVEFDNKIGEMNGNIQVVYGRL